MAKAVAMRRVSEATQSPISIVERSLFPSAADAQVRVDPLGARTFAALTAALGAIEAPALIVGADGEIVCSNVAARVFIRPGPDTPRRPASAAETGRLRARDWELSPIFGSGARAWSLMVLRPTAAPPDRWRLTARQSEILGLVVRGMTNATIAETLEIAVGTVEFHVAAIFDRAGVNNRAALIASLIRPKRLKHLDHEAGSRTSAPFGDHELDLTPGDHAILDGWSRSPNVSSALAMRARIVLASGNGEGVREIARRLGTTVPTVCAWRKRYRVEGIAGLKTRKIPGRPKELSPEVEQQIVNLTRNPPAGVARWSAARLGRKTGVSESTILRIWRRHGLRPPGTASPAPDMH